MKVSICCVTYNHEKYITETLNGFLMQCFDEEWEIVICDDASADGTGQILEEYKKKYPDRINLIRNTTNIGPSSNIIQAIKSCKGQYIAFCEGDDYWTEPLKLKKQAAILDSDPECSILWTNYWIRKDDTVEKPKFDLPFENNLYRIDLNNIFEPYVSLTLTTMVRLSVFDFDLIKKAKVLTDNLIYVMALNSGYGYHMNEYTGVYRFHSGGAHSLQSRFKKSINNYFHFKNIIRVFPSVRKLERLRKMRDGEFLNTWLYFFSDNRIGFFNSDTRAFLKAFFSFDTVRLALRVIQKPLKSFRVLRHGKFK